MAEICETKSEVVTSPVYGICTWKIDSRGILCSPSSDEPWWPRRPMRAYFRHGDYCLRTDLISSESCHCGLIAYKQLQDAASEILSPIYDGLECAIGIVALWGRIVEHEYGWRAEYSYPVWMCLLEPRGVRAIFKAADISGPYGIRVEALQFNPGDKFCPLIVRVSRKLLPIYRRCCGGRDKLLAR